MKTQRNIFIAFMLNLLFSVFELVGGIVTGSVAITSDALHDAGDAVSIGISYFLERKSKKGADAFYTYGYARYSVIGSFITTLILLIGSVVMIGNAVNRIINPIEIHYNGMILFAIVGACVNFCAALFTRNGDSLNQKAVNLHMLEDVFGWLVVLVGAVVMRFTNFALIDPIMSIGVSLFILIHAFQNMKEIVEVLAEKVPHGIHVAELEEHLAEIEGVQEVHHIHIWSLDGGVNLATLHVVTDSDVHSIKDSIREELQEHGITHVTIETEHVSEHCHHKHCHMEKHSHAGHGHHHGHHHHG